MEIINWEKVLIPYEQCVEELLTKFKELEKAYKKTSNHSPIELVEGRVKKIGSILGKAKMKNIHYLDIEKHIFDIAGIRIICRFVEDIEIVAELIKSRDGYDLEIISERNYIDNKKASGYRSYHIIAKYKVLTTQGMKEVFVEIQIRTMTMNFWATIEHSLNYKYDRKIPEDIKKRLYSASTAAYELDKEMSSIRDEITEALSVEVLRNNIVTEILKNIEVLYINSKIDNANELNKEFFKLFESASNKELQEFSNRVKTISNLYEEY